MNALLKFGFVLIVIISLMPAAYAKRVQTGNLEQPERKTDYLEKIYYSGLNKEGLLDLIDITIQSFEGTAVNSTVAKQYSFLSQIRAKVASSKSSCEALEMIATGIHALDKQAALDQEIPKPSAKVSDPLSSIVNSTQNVRYNASEMAYDAWILSNGNIGAYTTFSKVANGANKVGRTLDGINKVKKTADDVKKVLGSVGLGKADKECPKVPAKEVTIGEHSLPAAALAQTNTPEAKATAPVITNETKTVEKTTPAATTINIKNVDYAKLASIHERVKNCSIVSDSKMKIDVNGSSLILIHSGSFDDLLAQVLGSCKGIISDKNIVSTNPDDKIISFKL